MPPNTPVPIDWRAPAPAPVALTSGNTPSTKASEVMMMGRSRNRAASMAASAALRPLRGILRGELDNQDGVFRRQPDQHHQANLK